MNHQENSPCNVRKTDTFQKAGRILVIILSSILTLMLVLQVAFGCWSTTAAGKLTNNHFDITNRYNGYITNAIAKALDGFVKIEQVYMLSDNDMVAPKPDAKAFGQTDDPATLQWLINKSHLFMDGQDLLFSTDTEILEGSQVHYYMDDSILVITWKQPIEDVVYTLSEVKIAHPSQFRRFMSDGEYGSNRQYLTSEMSASVNAVVASAGDYYKFRSLGSVTVDRQVMRFNGNALDICFIDDNGDLLLSYGGDLLDLEEAQRFVDENNVRFSLCFGPVLVDNGKYVDAGYYPIGEIYMNYSRAAICQMGKLHYLMATANAESTYRMYPTIPSFGKVLESLGVEKAYALDGGQTATIVMNNEVINEVSYGAERYISDIIYFATAIPSDE